MFSLQPSIELWCILLSFLHISSSSSSAFWRFSSCSERNRIIHRFASCQLITLMTARRGGSCWKCHEAMKSMMLLGHYNQYYPHPAPAARPLCLHSSPGAPSVFRVVHLFKYRGFHSPVCLNPCLLSCTDRSKW